MLAQRRIYDTQMQQAMLIASYVGMMFSKDAEPPKTYDELLVEQRSKGEPRRTGKDDFDKLRTQFQIPVIRDEGKKVE